MTEERPVHPSAGEVAERGINVVRDAATDPKGVVVHSDSREPVKLEKQDEGKREDNAA